MDIHKGPSPFSARIKNLIKSKQDANEQFVSCGEYELGEICGNARTAHLVLNRLANVRWVKIAYNVPFTISDGGQV